MNTAKQAMESLEYVRGLLEEKQAGFAASVELAVSCIDRQIEWPEERWSSRCRLDATRSSRSKT